MSLVNLIFPEWGLLFWKKEKNTTACIFFLQIHHDGLFQVDCYCELNTTVLFSKLLFQLISLVSNLYPAKQKGHLMINRLRAFFLSLLTWAELRAEIINTKYLIVCLMSIRLLLNFTVEGLTQHRQWHSFIHGITGNVIMCLTDPRAASRCHGYHTAPLFKWII